MTAMIIKYNLVQTVRQISMLLTTIFANSLPYLRSLLFMHY